MQITDANKLTVFEDFCNRKMLPQGDEKIHSYNSFFFLTNNNQSENLCKNGLSIILFFSDQTFNFMRISQDLKKLQIESIFLNQVFK